MCYSTYAWDENGSAGQRKPGQRPSPLGHDFGRLSVVRAQGRAPDPLGALVDRWRGLGHSISPTRLLRLSRGDSL